MTVVEQAEQERIKVRCDNCGKPFRVIKPNFSSPYEQSVWLEKTRLCTDCTQLNIQPTQIKMLKNPNPKGVKWNPAEHGDHYLSNDIDEEEMKALVEKEKEIRKKNMELQRERLRNEFKKGAEE